MRKTICAFISLGLIMVYAGVNAQQEEKVRVTTYYPSPSGVYQTMRLNPGPVPADPKPGQLFYNNTTDGIQYYNISGKWVNLTGSGVSLPYQHVDNRTSPPAGAVAGIIYFNNTSNTVEYLNKQGKWIRWSAPGYWNESAKITEGNLHYYPVFLANHTNRRLGIGTKTPQTALSVYKSENSSDEEPVIASFTKILNAGSSGSPKNQTLSFALFPNGTANTYLNSTSLIYTPASPGGSLQLTVNDEPRSISFNVGGYNNSATEVMRLINRGDETYPAVRVGIGNSTPRFGLFVDSNANTSAFGVRGTSFGLKTGIGTITPYNDSVWITYGCYLENNTWKNDRYEYPASTLNTKGAALVIKPDDGVRWYCYDTSGLSSDKKNVTSWSVTGGGGKLLWDRTGLIYGGSSSRTLKENFAPLDPNAILQSINRLEISRWKYKVDQEPVTHIGPMAEDFNNIFQLGDFSKKNIAVIDQIGVTLAVVKALSWKIKTQQQTIKELQTEVKYLESQLRRRRSGGI